MTDDRLLSVLGIPYKLGGCLVSVSNMDSKPMELPFGPLLGFGDLAHTDDNRMYLQELRPTFHILALITVGEFLALFQASEILLKSWDVGKFTSDVLANRNCWKMFLLFPGPVEFITLKHLCPSNRTHRITARAVLDFAISLTDSLISIYFHIWHQ